MKKINRLNLVWCCMLVVSYLLSETKSTAQNGLEVNIIPAPAAVVYQKGEFVVDKDIKIVGLPNNQETANIAQYCNDQVKTLTGLNLSVVTSAKPVRKSILLKTGYASGNKEAYSFTVTKNGIVIDGASQAGLFYGVQTLLQLLYPVSPNNAGFVVRCMEIKDEPSFSWRGMHLDVCRHFFSVDFVKKMIDMMAFQKMNMFHWHLTDDQGWRIEIKKYPKLNEISAYRDETMVGQYTDTAQKFDGIRYGGYYTQEQIREVVKYAQSRYITVVPEIEMPGHAVAALSAYPEYSCTGGPFKVYTKWGVSDDVYCPGKEETFQFLQNILSEVIDLFPGPYVHIGGDECPKTRWKSCPACQKRIKDEGLKDELELQSYFVKRMEKFIASKGKRLIGWDEILEGGLPERATVMSWRGYEGGVEAVNSGHDVVMTPGGYCYLDHYQAKENEPLAFNAYLPLEQVYSFKPIPPSVTAEGKKHILGGQANVWTEYIPTEKQAEYMIFPRLCAMADVLWAPESQRNYANFLIRLDTHLKRLQKLNVNYRPLDKR